MSRAWLCWAALGWGCQNRSNMENARRGPTVPTVLCFQVGVADCKVCLLPSSVQEGCLQIPTLTQLPWSRLGGSPSCCFESVLGW